LKRRGQQRHFGENFLDLPGQKRRRGSFVGRWLRRVMLLALFVLLLPYLLLPVYRIEAIRPVSTLMLYDMLRGAPVTREWVEFEDIAPVLVQSVMMSEDARFCAHDGVDWESLNTVIEETLEGETTRGASTIAMQTAKNLFLWQSRSFLRKGMEIPLALAADYVWSKRRLMEIYLNIAEWGPNGQFGVEAGARRAFNKSAANLTAGEAALLAAVLPNPIRRSARTPGPAVRRIAGRLQARAAASPAIDDCLRPKRQSGS
jgi:monofunctional biosynthetic peptidoglycan transglycosylase